MYYSKGWWEYIISVAGGWVWRKVLYVKVWNGWTHSTSWYRFTNKTMEWVDLNCPAVQRLIFILIDWGGEMVHKLSPCALLNTILSILCDPAGLHSIDQHFSICFWGFWRPSTGFCLHRLFAVETHSPCSAVNEFMSTFKGQSAVETASAFTCCIWKSMTNKVHLLVCLAWSTFS